MYPTCHVRSSAARRRSVRGNRIQREGVGGIHQLTDDTEAVAKTYEYNPFGRILGETGSAPNDFTLPATYAQVSGVPDLRLSPTRTYDARLGRFCQRDPEPVGPQESLYVWPTGNPMGTVDTDGADKIPVDKSSGNIREPYEPIAPPLHIPDEHWIWDFLRDSRGMRPNVRDFLPLRPRSLFKGKVNGVYWRFPRKQGEKVELMFRTDKNEYRTYTLDTEAVRRGAGRLWEELRHRWEESFPARFWRCFIEVLERRAAEAAEQRRLRRREALERQRSAEEARKQKAAPKEPARTRQPKALAARRGEPLTVIKFTKCEWTVVNPPLLERALTEFKQGARIKLTVAGQVIPHVKTVHVEVRVTGVEELKRKFGQERYIEKTEMTGTDLLGNATFLFEHTYNPELIRTTPTGLVFAFSVTANGETRSGKAVQDREKNPRPANYY
jgi:RHS repeat-associated protein